MVFQSHVDSIAKDALDSDAALTANEALQYTAPSAGVPDEGETNRRMMIETANANAKRFALIVKLNANLERGRDFLDKELATSEERNMKLELDRACLMNVLASTRAELRNFKEQVAADNRDRQGQVPGSTDESVQWSEASVTSTTGTGGPPSNSTTTGRTWQDYQWR